VSYPNGTGPPQAKLTVISGGRLTALPGLLAGTGPKPVIDAGGIALLDLGSIAF